MRRLVGAVAIATATRTRTKLTPSAQLRRGVTPGVLTTQRRGVADAPPRLPTTTTTTTTTLKRQRAARDLLGSLRALDDARRDETREVSQAQLETLLRDVNVYAAALTGRECATNVDVRNLVALAVEALASVEIPRDNLFLLSSATSSLSKFAREGFPTTGKLGDTLSELATAVAAAPLQPLSRPSDASTTPPSSALPREQTNKHTAAASARDPLGPTLANLAESGLPSDAKRSVFAEKVLAMIRSTPDEHLREVPPRFAVATLAGLARAPRTLRCTSEMETIVMQALPPYRVHELERSHIAKLAWIAAATPDLNIPTRQHLGVVVSGYVERKPHILREMPLEHVRSVFLALGLSSGTSPEAVRLATAELFSRIDETLELSPLLVADVLRGLALMRYCPPEVPNLVRRLLSRMEKTVKSADVDVAAAASILRSTATLAIVLPYPVLAMCARALDRGGLVLESRHVVNTVFALACHNLFSRDPPPHPNVAIARMRAAEFLKTAPVPERAALSDHDLLRLRLARLAWEASVSVSVSTPVSSSEAEPEPEPEEGPAKQPAAPETPPPPPAAPPPPPPMPRVFTHFRPSAQSSKALLWDEKQLAQASQFALNGAEAHVRRAKQLAGLVSEAGFPVTFHQTVGGFVADMVVILPASASRVAVFLEPETSFFRPARGLFAAEGGAETSELQASEPQQPSEPQLEQQLEQQPTEDEPPAPSAALIPTGETVFRRRVIAHTAPRHMSVWFLPLKDLTAEDLIAQLESEDQDTLREGVVGMLSSSSSSSS